MIKLIVWLLLAALVRNAIQQCTIEEFEDSIALDLLRNSESTDFNQNFIINRTIYNCLATSQTIDRFKSMSVSLIYIRSDSPDRLRDVRYDLLCGSDVWMRYRQISAALESSDTRTDCSSCISTANDHHCACKYMYIHCHSYTVCCMLHESLVGVEACMNPHTKSSQTFTSYHQSMIGSVHMPDFSLS